MASFLNLHVISDFLHKARPKKNNLLDKSGCCRGGRFQEIASTWPCVPSLTLLPGNGTAHLSMSGMSGRCVDKNLTHHRLQFPTVANVLVGFQVESERTADICVKQDVAVGGGWRGLRVRYGKEFLWQRAAELFSDEWEWPFNPTAAIIKAQIKLFSLRERKDAVLHKCVGIFPSILAPKSRMFRKKGLKKKKTFRRVRLEHFETVVPVTDRLCNRGDKFCSWWFGSLLILSIL